MGGGLKEVGIRFSLSDGDNAKGNFDYNKNFLLVNGINFGNWSDVTTLGTDSLGKLNGVSNSGFQNNVLNTGWFYKNDTSLLSSFYQSLVTTSQAKYEFNDLTPGDQYLDFKKGISESNLNVGKAPVVIIPDKTPAVIIPDKTSDVPEPTNILNTIFGIFGLGYVALMRERKKQRQQTFK